MPLSVAVSGLVTPIKSNNFLCDIRIERNAIELYFHFYVLLSSSTHFTVRWGASSDPVAENEIDVAKMRCVRVRVCVFDFWFSQCSHSLVPQHNEKKKKCERTSLFISPHIFSVLLLFRGRCCCCFFLFGLFKSNISCVMSCKQNDFPMWKFYKFSKFNMNNLLARFDFCHLF